MTSEFDIGLTPFTVETEESPLEVPRLESGGHSLCGKRQCAEGREKRTVRTAVYSVTPRTDSMRMDVALGCCVKSFLRRHGPSQFG
jgi:hypothetical protein